MAKIIRARERKLEFEYYLFFESKREPGSGHQFKCSKEGELEPITIPEAIKSLDLARRRVSHGLAHEPRVIDYQRRYAVPALLECDCLQKFELVDLMTNQCPNCKEFFNGCGQHLSHPSQWGEETGERFDDAGREIL